MKETPFTLITGASEGFGKALAIECALRKMNLILVALPEPGLEDLAEFIRNKFNVRVYALGKDLSNEKECYDLHAEIRQLHLPINILINNAGLGGTLMFSEGSPELFSKQIKLNILAPTLLTKLFLNELIQHKKSYILNVSSLSCFYFLPRKSVYGSSKAYIHYFSKSLRKELEPLGVSVTVISPGGMFTNPSISIMTNCGTWFTRNSAMNPEDVAPIAIDGMLKGKEVIIPGKLNRLFRFIDHFLPAGLKNAVATHQMEQLHSPSFLKKTSFASYFHRNSKRLKRHRKLPASLLH